MARHNKKAVRMIKACWALVLLVSLAPLGERVLAEAPSTQKRLATHGHVGNHATWCALHVVNRQYPEAIEDCDEALANDPNDAKAYSNRSAAYGMIGEVDRAITDIEAALRLSSSDSSLHYNRGLLLSKNGQLAAAVAAYTEGIRLNPLHAHAYNNRGALFERIGERDKAIDDYRRALELFPHLTLAKENLKRLGH